MIYGDIEILNKVTTPEVQFLQAVLGQSEINHYIYKQPEEMMSCMTELVKVILSEVLGSFSDQESKVIRLAFGLNGGIPMPVKDVGECLGITGAQVYVIKKKALEKLRCPSGNELLKTHLDKLFISKCRHYWILDCMNVGICKNCGSHKDFGQLYRDFLTNKSLQNKKKREASHRIIPKNPA